MKKNLRRAQLVTVLPLLIAVILVIIALSGCTSTARYNYEGDPSLKLHHMVQAYMQNPEDPPYSLEKISGFAQYAGIPFNPAPLLKIRQEHGFTKVRLERERFYQQGEYIEPEVVLASIREIERNYGLTLQPDQNFAADIYERHKLNVAFMLKHLRQNPGSEAFALDEIRAYAKKYLRYADWPKTEVLDDIDIRYHQSQLSKMFDELANNPGTSTVTAADIRAYAKKYGIAIDTSYLTRIQLAHERALEWRKAEK